MTTAPNSQSTADNQATGTTHSMAAPHSTSDTQSTATADGNRPTPTFAASGGPVPGFVDLLRSELGRLINLRSTWFYAVAILAFIVGLPVMMWAVTQGGPAEFRYEPNFAQVLIGNDMAVLIAIIFAAAGSSSEISGRRVAFGYLSSNSRTGVHVARMCAQVLIVAAILLIGFVAAAGFLAVVGALIPEGPGLAFTMIGLALLWTAIGSAVGMLIPFTAAAVGVPLAWMLVVEFGVSSVPLEFLQTLTKYLPWISTRQLSDMMDIGVSDLQAGVVLAAWSIAVIGAGLVLARRRDVK